MNIRLSNKEYNISKKEILMLIIIFILIIAIVLVTINKNKKLLCVVSRSNITVNSEEKITANFKNNKLTKITFYYKTRPTPNYLYTVDKLYDILNAQLIAYKNDGGHDYTIDKTDSYVSYNSIFDISEIPDSTKEKMGYDENWTYKDVKEDLERNEFKCK